MPKYPRVEYKDMGSGGVVATVYDSPTSFFSRLLLADEHIGDTDVEFELLQELRAFDENVADIKWSDD